MAGTIIGAVQIVPLVIALLFGLVFFVVVMFFSFRSRDRIRRELVIELRTHPSGTIGPAQRRARRTLLMSVVSAPIILTLAIVALISTNDHRGVPTWDSWLLAIFFWGALGTLVFQSIRRKRRRDRLP